MGEEIKFMMLRDYKLADKLSPIFTEILKERINQNKKWGEQNHPMYREIEEERYPAESVLKNTLSRSRKAVKNGDCWFDILIEEICEAFIETEPKKQRGELIQVAAVTVAIIECLDKKIEAEAQHGN
jgi:hypothetical protein